MITIIYHEKDDRHYYCNRPKIIEFKMAVARAGSVMAPAAASSAGMRKKSLQGCIYSVRKGALTETDPAIIKKEYLTKYKHTEKTKLALTETDQTTRS